MTDVDQPARSAPAWRPRFNPSPAFWAVVPALALVTVVFLVPVTALLVRSVLEPVPGLQNFAEFFGSPTYVKVLGNTFLVAGITTVLSILLGLPVAWFLAIAPVFWSRLLFAILVLSMWTNLLARTYAWMVLLQRTGIINRGLMSLGLISEPLPLINNLVGVTIGMTYIMLPFVILPMHTAIRSLDPAIFQAAALCGANLRQSFVRVFLPLIASSIAAGGVMVFVISLGYFITPSLLGGTSNMVLAELIAQLIQSLLDWGLGATAALVLLAITLSVYAIQLRFLGFGTSSGAR